MTFEGTDPAIERSDPKIQDVTLTFDPKVLKQYSVVIKKLMAANNVMPPVIPKRGKKVGKDEKPPEVEN